MLQSITHQCFFCHSFLTVDCLQTEVNQPLQANETVNITRYWKQKGQSRMDNPETLGTLGTHDTERRQAKQKH